MWERLIAFWNYSGARELVPARLGLFESTPIVNDEFVSIVKSGKCEYIRCDIERLTKDGAKVKVRGREEKPGEGKEEKEVSICANYPHHEEFMFTFLPRSQIKGDVVVLATGFKKPDIGFFKDDLFPDSYEVYVQQWPFIFVLGSLRDARSGQICTCRTSRRKTGRYL